MGLFDKIKKTVEETKTKIQEEAKKQQEEAAKRQEEAAKRQEEEAKKREEEAKKQQEALRFNPKDKNMEWFSSENGLKTFSEYMTAKNYILDEIVKNEHETRYSEYDFDNWVKVFHPEAKIPTIFFNQFVKNIKIDTIYVAPYGMIVDVLKMQAKPFILDDEGEPQIVEPMLSAPEIFSNVKNPVLNFVSNFKCFKLTNDDEGTYKEKFKLWCDILIWISVFFPREEDIIANNQWIFSKDTYFNDLGIVRKPKAFYKKCIELSSQKDYFEKLLNEVE